MGQVEQEAYSTCSKPKWTLMSARPNPRSLTGDEHSWDHPVDPFTICNDFKETNTKKIQKIFIFQK